jgi:dTDP-4-amino-4,6-dideoxygalactose transaminase
MATNSQSRRRFLKQNILGGIGATLAPSIITASTATATPAILGGDSAWSKRSWPKWPKWVPETDEKQLLEVIRSGVWSRSSVVTQFEKEWAATVGSKRALTTVNGTNALVVALNQLGVQAGDEVLVPPYTFVSTITSILSNNAIPVFVDIDPLTYQIDPAKIEAKITSRTKAILPVHILGLPADMPKIMAIAKKHKLIVLEDACQAHLAEVNGKQVGTIGDAGCFSFQNSKNLAIGEGGAIVSDNENFMDRCFSYHNLGTPYGTAVGTVGVGSIMQATKVRLTEYQAAIGIALLKRLDAETRLRSENAAYLKSMIKDIPGIVPYKEYDCVTRSAFHLFAFRFKSEQFKGLSRNAFLQALRAEEIPSSSGYTSLNTQPFLASTFASDTYKKIYTAKELDIKAYNERNHCPENLKLVDEAVWFTQNMLLASRQDMEHIAQAIRKIYTNADKIKASTK